MTTLHDIRVSNANRQVEWTGGKQRPSLSFRGNELAGEVGEACNILKKIERERMGYPGSRATVEDLAEELADVVLCVDLTAMEFDIDLGAAVERKFNKTSEKVGLESRFVIGSAVDSEELEYLRYFFQTADFGPAHEDVVDIINERYRKDTGKDLPEGYRSDEGEW